MPAIIAWNRARRSMAQSPGKNFFLACIGCTQSMALDLLQESILSYHLFCDMIKPLVILFADQFTNSQLLEDFSTLLIHVVRVNC